MPPQQPPQGFMPPPAEQSVMQPQFNGTAEGVPVMPDLPNNMPVDKVQDEVVQPPPALNESINTEDDF